MAGSDFTAMDAIILALTDNLKAAQDALTVLQAGGGDGDQVEIAKRVATLTPLSAQAATLADGIKKLPPETAS